MTATAFAPLVASTGGEIKLSMQRLWLTGLVLPVGARLWVRHEFRSGESLPVEAIYTFMLPRDAALRRFKVTGQDFEAESQLLPTADAMKAYESGVEIGALSTLVRQYGDGLVSLTVGHLRPAEAVVVTLEILAGVEQHDDGLRFRFPFTLAPSYHAGARVMENGPGWGEMELPPEEFDDLILPRFAQSAEGLHEVGFDLTVEMGTPITELASPSHSIRVRTETLGRSRVLLSREADLPNRDLVLDIQSTDEAPTVLAGADGAGRCCVAAVIPSTKFGKASSEPRKVVFLLDRSGSMEGSPIRQAKLAIDACLGALEPEDQFGLAAFDNSIEVFQPALAPASGNNRNAAREFLRQIDARGGTELAAGFAAAARLLAGHPGDILIVTDGQVFGGETILARAREVGARLHCLGIGSASQDRFLSQLSGQTGGVCRFLTPAERVDLSAIDLFSAVGRPVASGVTVSAEGAEIPAGHSDAVFAGTPFVVFATALERGVLRITWAGEGTGIALAFVVEKNELGETLRLLLGAKLLADLETRVVPAHTATAVERREARRISERLVRLSAEYGLASREMSLVAVVRRPGDRPSELPQTIVVPVGMPWDMRFDAVFPALSSSSRCQVEVSREIPARAVLFDAAPAGEADLLVRLAAMLEAEGGMPGKSAEARLANSLAALLCFLVGGSTRRRGPFRSHVRRLLAFLETQPLEHWPAATAILLQLNSDVVPAGDWLRHGRSLADFGEVDQEAFRADLTSAVTASTAGPLD